MSWSKSDIRNGSWKPNTRFVEVSAYDGACAEVATLRASQAKMSDELARLSIERNSWKAEVAKAVAILRRFDVAVTNNVNEPVFDACGPFATALDAMNRFIAAHDKVQS